MNKDIERWSFISHYLQSGEAVALLAVIGSSGSSPGRQGFNMAVSCNGSLCGSIGGGIMEVKLVELALARLRDQDYSFILKKQIHNKTASRDQSGMICSGEQTVAISFLKPAIAGTANKLVQILRQYQPVMITILQKSGNQILEFEEIANPLQLPPVQFSLDKANDFKLCFPAGFRDRLYIVGGGHCALALSEIMSKLDFHICLLDDRPGLATVNKNSFVHEKHLLTSYSEAGQFIPAALNVYVVVMTLGYRTDEIVIRQLLKSKFKYLGLLGSKAKIKTLLATLKEDGFSGEQLNALFAPIGLQINSHTPEEIAISIAAQIISIKNR